MFSLLIRLLYCNCWVRVESQQVCSTAELLLTVRPSKGHTFCISLCKTCSSTCTDQHRGDCESQNVQQKAGDLGGET